MSQDYQEEQYYTTHLATFKVGSIELATKIQNVEQIIELSPVRKLPKVPALIEGVMEVSGKIVTVIDLRRLFRIENPLEEELKVIIYSLGQMRVGFIVDDVLQVVQRSQEKILETPPLVIHGFNDDCIFGMLHENDRHVLLIDFEKIFTHQQTQIISQATNQV